MKVTICGSMRHISEMINCYRKLSLEGHLVYLPVFLKRRTNVDKELKTKLQQLHFQKIADSDLIFVVNPKGYIGQDTMTEIEFAKKLSKDVIFQE